MKRFTEEQFFVEKRVLVFKQDKVYVFTFDPFMQQNLANVVHRHRWI